MSNVGILKEDIKTFSDLELQDLFDFIGDIMSLNSLTHSLPKDCRESRFSKGEVCPHCNSTHVVKNGKLNDKQRYKCRTCNRTFNDFTKSALSNVVRQNIALWNCIPKSNYNYNTNNYLVINCFLNKHIIAMTKTPNDLTSSGAYFMLIIKTRERKRKNP